MSDATPPRKRPRGSMAFSLGSKTSSRSPDPNSPAMRALAAANSRPQTPQTHPVQLLKHKLPSTPPRPQTADFSQGKDNESAQPQLSISTTAISTPNRTVNSSRASVPDSSRLIPGSGRQPDPAESSNMHFSLFDKIELSEADSILSEISAAETDSEVFQAHAMRGRVNDGNMSIETRGYTVKGRSRLSRHYIQDVNPAFGPSEKLTQVIIWCLDRRIRHLHRKAPESKSLASELARVTLNKLLVRLQSKKAQLDWSQRPGDEPLPPPMRGKLNTLNEKTLEGFISYRKALANENENWPQLWAQYEKILREYSTEMPKVDPESTDKPLPIEVMTAERELQSAAKKVLSLEEIPAKFANAELVKDAALETLDNLRERTSSTDSVALLRALTRERS